MSGATESREAPTPHGRIGGGEWKKHVVILLIFAIELFPFYMMLQMSVKDNATFIANPWLPPNPVVPGETVEEASAWHWENFIFAFKLILPYVANTVLVAVSSAVGTLFFAVLGAYFFGRYKVPFAGTIWMVFIFLLLMPKIANLVPLFELLRDLSLLNTLWALVIVHVAGGQAFNLFVLRNFVEEIPKDLFEAADMDGANHLQQIFHIVVPLSASILGSLAIFILIGSWNEYILPLVVLRDKDLFTIGVGIIYLDGQYVKEWGPIMAAYFVSSIPLIVIFMFTMKLFIKGITAGAVKG